MPVASVDEMGRMFYHKYRSLLEVGDFGLYQACSQHVLMYTLQLEMCDDLEVTSYAVRWHAPSQAFRNTHL